MRFKQFKLDPIVESVITEVEMSPSSLQRWASGPDAEGMLMGIEFEMCVPGVVAHNSEDADADYSMDEYVDDIEEIEGFFELDSSQVSDLENEYQEWWFDHLNEEADNQMLDADDRIAEIIKEDHYDFDQALERAREELGDETDEDVIENRAAKIRDDEIQEMIADNSREWEIAYDQVREEIEEELRMNNDYSQRQWLRSIGVRYFSDVEMKWGFYWPYRESGEGDVTVDQIGEELSKVLRLSKVNTSLSYHGATREEGIWSIETDSSIDVGEIDDGGLEFISPAQPIAKTLEEMEKLWQWANDKGCYTNSSTGLHMNISVPNFASKKLDYIKLAIFSGDKYVLEQFGRLGNTYCKSATDIIKRKTNEDNVKQVLEKMRGSLDATASKLIHSGLTEKYTSINTKEGYVEFRGPGNDYLSMQPEQLTNTALRLAMALHIACDENAYKKEYARKLYKLIAPQDSNNNTVGLVSQYIAGDLDRKSLVNKLELIRTTRIEKANKAAGIEKPVPALKPAANGSITIPLEDVGHSAYAKYLDYRGNWEVSRVDNPLITSPWENSTPRYIYEKLFARFGNLSQHQITLVPGASAPQQQQTTAVPAGQKRWKITSTRSTGGWTIHTANTAQEALEWIASRTGLTPSEASQYYTITPVEEEQR